MQGMDRIFDICNALRDIRTTELDDETLSRLEREEERRNTLERYKSYGIPQRYLEESFDTYDAQEETHTKALNQSKKFVQNARMRSFKTLVLLGNAGTGKTHLACSILKETGGKYRTASSIVEEMRGAKSFTSYRTEEQLIEQYGRTSLLVIDEIGRGINATDEKYMIYQVLNARYNTEKPTVLISNHNKKEFLQYIGVATADRLVESADIVEMTGESYRLTKRVINDTKKVC